MRSKEELLDNLKALNQIRYNINQDIQPICLLVSCRENDNSTLVNKKQCPFRHTEYCCNNMKYFYIYNKTIAEDVCLNMILKKIKGIKLLLFFQNCYENIE